MTVSNNVSDTIERDILIAAPAEKVWEVVSIPGWWINEGSALELSLIERITEDRALVHHPKHGDFLVERLDVDPPRAVSFRWLVSGAEGPRIAVAEDQLLPTRVTLTLTPEPGGTAMENCGFLRGTGRSFRGMKAGCLNVTTLQNVTFWDI